MFPFTSLFFHPFLFPIVAFDRRCVLLLPVQKNVSTKAYIQLQLPLIRGILLCLKQQRIITVAVCCLVLL
ncbi:hypothetical protein Lalb_Chr12g0204091 [Lupinus albus]|uniref:Uncharacterized protein n=1 Tax=Lupinus albus TaxID=3870 RepID=A0A6A4PNN9_LUPAL|nr:hypothetical protein Lalb_Chr12g0204091 [Lupinus albus]